MLDQENGRVSSEGQESTANSLENFVPDNYDAMRGSIVNNENYDPSNWNICFWVLFKHS